MLNSRKAARKHKPLILNHFSWFNRKQAQDKDLKRGKNILFVNGFNVFGKSDFNGFPGKK
jgi:hypothetical protein